MYVRSLLLMLATVVAGAGLRAQANELAEPLVFVVADGDRARAIDDILRGAGLRRRKLATADCTPSALRLADVVVVDWPEGVDLGATSPLGGLDRWDRPTVFVGSSGARFARRWLLPDPAAIAAMDVDDLGPEMGRMPPPADAVTRVMRQGHLFHFTCTPAPGAFAADERTWFVDTVRYAARFATDRPILHCPTIDGAPLSPDELVRRQRIETLAQQWQIEPNRQSALVALPERLDGVDRQQAEALLLDLVADGPGPDTTRNNWRNWLTGRRDKLVWDDLSRVWRLDELAYWRGIASQNLRNGARAGGGERDAEALALAAKVAQHYGGRAFDDLATFACWQGDVRCLWDRRNGWFRVENHHLDLPAKVRATQWEVAVFDTAADRDVIWGGGPPPRTRVSARSQYRSLAVRVFLPALLLNPGTSLDRRRGKDADSEQVLVVRLAQRGLDLNTEYHVVVLANGDILQVEEWRDRKRGAVWRLEGTTLCGPLRLLTSWSNPESRLGREYTITDPVWNPDLPAGLESATEQLTEPRAR